MVISSAALLALSGVACGGGDGKSGTDGSETNYISREAITDALESEKSLDTKALDIIGRVRAGQYDLQNGLDDIVDQTKELMPLIIGVSTPGEPQDDKLAEARTLTEEYLRNRMHQLERAFSAQSGEELESTYTADKAELDGIRNRIVELLILYSPDLENTVR